MANVIVDSNTKYTAAGSWNVYHDDTTQEGDQRQWAAQTFTASETYTLVEVQLKCSKKTNSYGPPVGNATLELFATSAGEPTGAALDSSAVLASDLPAEGSAAYYSWTFTGGYELQASTQYVLVLKAPSCTITTTGYVAWFFTTENEANGTLLHSEDEGTTWSDESGAYDFNFRTYKTPPPVINKTSLGSLGLFVVCATDDGLYLSTDFGSNWTQSLPDGDSDISWSDCMCSTGGTYMIAIRESDGAIYRTANGGTGWAAITPAGADTFTPVAIDASDDGAYILIVGSNATDASETIWRSEDYGSSWTNITNPTITGANYDWTGCQISNDGKILMVSRENAFYLSFDSGDTWEEASVPAAGSDWACTGISGDGKVGLICDVTVANQFYTNSGWYKKPVISEATITETALSILDDDSVADAATTLGLGTTDSPEWTGATFSGLTASRIVATDGSKGLVSLASPLIVAEGGSGAITLTDHGILLGSGTGAITPLAAATNGQIPIGSTGADPVLATLTGTANQIAVTNAAGSITLSLTGNMDELSALTPTDGNFIVGNDTTWVAESGATVRTSIGLGTSNSPQFAGITATDGTRSMVFTPSTSILQIVGTASSFSQTAQLQLKASGDNDPLISFMSYSHDNIALVFDARINPVGAPNYWLSSDVGSNFALYKTSDMLGIYYHSGTAKGSGFAGFSNTGVRFDTSGRMGVGINPAEQIHVSDTIRADTFFNHNGTDGVSTTFLDADGNTITVSGGIITAKTAP